MSYIPIIMCRWLLSFCLMLGLALGPCAVACGLTAMDGDACCVVINDEPCCPDKPSPSCQCEAIDEPALPPDVVELPTADLSHDVVLTAIRQLPSTNVIELSQDAARAPPGLSAWRCVVLVI